MTGWMADAACREHPDLGWVVVDVDPVRELGVCGGCPVRDQCLDYALRHDMEHGIWGGFTASERRRIAKGRPARTVREQRRDRTRRARAIKGDHADAAAHDLVVYAAQRAGFTALDVLASTSRHPDLLAARRGVMVALRDDGWTLSRIARLFGVSHQTVANHLTKVAADA